MRYRIGVLDVFRGTERFEVVRELGTGGIGTVYEALDREQNCRVALKFLQRLDPQALLRFKSEYRVASGVHHRNLVRLGDLIEDRGRWFFTMELVTGEGFVRHVRRGRDCDCDRLRSALRQLASGLMALHDAGQVHRDIKPSNVLVTETGRVVLLDFGVATAIGGKSSQGAPRAGGSCEYMAPEQAMGEAAGASVDWYSVGVLVYQALTGELPFAGDSAHIRRRKMAGDPPRARDAVATVPEDLDELCCKLLCRTPSDRADGAEILRVLGAGEAGDAGARSAAPKRSLAAGSAPHGKLDSGPAGPKAFFGRKSELSLLRQAARESRDGPVAVIIRGFSGIGKTALLEAFCQKLGTPDSAALLLQGRCLSRESVPYKAFDAAIDALTHWLADLDDRAASDLLPADVGFLVHMFPVLRRAGAIASAPPPAMGQASPSEVRERTFSALAELIGRIAVDLPVVLTIDDIQWADDDSRALLRALLRHSDKPPILIVTSERLPPLAERTSHAPFALSDRARQLDLEPLPASDAVALARHLFDSATHTGQKLDRDDWAEAVAERSGGHPVFLRRIARAALASPGGAVPAVRDLLRRELAELDPRARRILDLLCAARDPLGQDTCATAAKLAFTDFVDRARTLVAVGLARLNGSRRADTVELYHQWVHEALSDALDDAAMAELHRDIATALEMASATDSERLSRHWIAAGNTARGRESAIAAAAAAEHRGDHGRAAKLYQRALSCQPDDPATALRLAECLIEIGRAEAAGNALLHAAECSPAIRAPALVARAAGQIVRAGHVARGLEELADVCSGMGLPMPRRSAVPKLVWQRVLLRLYSLRFRERPAETIRPSDLRRIDILADVVMGLMGVDRELCAAVQRELVSRAVRAGERGRLERSLATGYILEAASAGSAQRRRARLSTAISELIARTDSAYVRAMALLARGVSTLAGGDFASARDDLSECLDLLAGQRPDPRKEIDLCALHLLGCLCNLGDLDAARAVFDRTVSAARERGDHYGETALGLGPTVAIWLAPDQVDTACEWVDRAARDVDEAAAPILRYRAVIARCAIDLYRDQPHEAVERLAASDLDFHRTRVIDIQSARIQLADIRGRAHLALAAARSGVDSDQLSFAMAQARLLDREQSGWASALAAAVRAGVATLAGKATAADWSHAASRFTSAGMRWHAAACHWRRAAFLDAGADLRAEAEDSLRQLGVAAPARFAAMLAPASKASRDDD